MKTLIYIFSLIVWFGFVYTALTTVLYFVNFVFDFSIAEDRGVKALVLVAYIVLLEILAIIFQKSPHKPKGKAFDWLNKLSLFS